ncbi:MAG TPA: DUF1343 domain-containing protein, partial [Pyrinomonadaceae bacterium]|nr:DUF1343 domain-containing protein [Pyrinomonadaceae bacterium]
MREVCTLKRAGYMLVLIAFAIAISTLPARPAYSNPPPIFPGIDVLLAYYPQILVGKRVGVISHRAATSLRGYTTAALLSLVDRVKVVALFVPEHGFSGTLPAGVFVPSSSTGVPIHSLYSKDKKPTDEMIAGIDILVLDLQDAGTRAYTYISTMALAMEAAAEHSKRFIVLDRPNPLGAVRVDGPMLDPDFASFIGIRPVPSVYGMTIGELAWMFNEEFKIGADLAVVPMSNYERRMHWRDTGLPWVNPSPMLTSPEAAELHAVTGMLEGTNLVIGAGGSIPFETVTAPWIRGDLLAARLNLQRLPGIRFVPHQAGRNRRSGGIRLILTDPRQVRPASTAVHILHAVNQLHPGKLQFTAPSNGGRYLFDLVWGTDDVRRAILRGENAKQTIAAWDEGI